jgi:hypothetical protein
VILNDRPHFPEIREAAFVQSTAQILNAFTAPGAWFETDNSLDYSDMVRSPEGKVLIQVN